MKVGGLDCEKDSNDNLTLVLDKFIKGDEIQRDTSPLYTDKPKGTIHNITNTEIQQDTNPLYIGKPKGAILNINKTEIQHDTNPLYTVKPKGTILNI